MTPGAVRVGFVGCGWWATSAHMPTVAGRDDAEVVAIAESDPERRAAAAERFGVEATFADAAELLEGAEVDAVVIAVPNVHHHPVARLALEHGKHVLLEKPMVLDVADGRELIELAEERRLALVIGYTMHFNPQAIALREAIAAGRIGPIEHVSCLYASVMRELYHGRPESYEETFGYLVHGPAPESYVDRGLAGGGQGQSQLTHCVGMMFFLTGLRTERVAAFNQSFELPVDLADTLAVRFEGGATAAIGTIGSVLPNHEEIVRYEIFGRDGHIVFDINRGLAEIRDADGVERLPEITPEERIPNPAPVTNLVEMVQGRATNGSPPEIGLQAVQLVDLMYRSAESGAFVDAEDLGIWG